MYPLPAQRIGDLVKALRQWYMMSLLSPCSEWSSCRRVSGVMLRAVRGYTCMGR